MATPQTTAHAKMPSSQGFFIAEVLMTDIKKSYYAIIPANIRYDKRLPARAILLYGEITALTNEKGYCWASNTYFANLYNVTPQTVSGWISLLVKHGYVTRQIQYKEGTKEIEGRYIQICGEGIKKNLNRGINENLKGNITLSNITLNKDNVLSGNNPTPHSLAPYKKIIEYLNKVANTNFRVETTSTRRKIKARWNEGFRFDDFKRVIDVKWQQWKDDDKMVIYIRPETLFGTKFESYLQEHTERQIQEDVAKMIQEAIK